MARAIHVFRTPDRFVAGTVGEPGDRVFYLQAVHDSRVVSVTLEKQQVKILADRMGLLLEEDAAPSDGRIPRRGDGPAPLSEDAPLPAQTSLLDDTEDGPDAVRVFLTPEQALEFAARSEMVVSAGRTPCPLCGEPIDGGGHVCIRTNGYLRTPGFDPATWFGEES